MKRSIPTVALLFTSISAIIGSGWLFSSYYTSLLAGPGALLAWVIGGAITIVIAFTFAEISAMLPIMGSTSRIPQYTHGTVVSFTFSWIIWLSYVALAATEVQAVIQYMSYYFPYLIHANGGLTEKGYVAAGFLMLIITSINIFSIHWLIRLNSGLTILKVSIPILIAICILAVCYEPTKITHPAHSVFLPFGFHGVLSAISTGGIVYAFVGFKQACELAGEAKRPGVAVPVAVIGSILVCLAIFIVLQMAFFTSLHPSNLLHGWSHLTLAGKNSPFAAILMQNHMGWLQPILYVGAIIGPLAASMMFCASGGRSLFAMSKNDYLALIFRQKNRHHIPWVAVIVSSIAGMFLFAPLPGWNKMTSFLSSLMSISYASAPIALLTLRYQVPGQKRPLQLPFATLWTTVALYFCSLLSYWSGWQVISKFGVSIILGFIILLSYHFFTVRGRELTLNFRESIWMWPYLLGLILISYLGNFGHGLGVLPFGWDFAALALLSTLTMWLAVRFRLPNECTEKYIRLLPLKNIHK